MLSAWNGAAIGLGAFFGYAVCTQVRVGGYSPHFGLANEFRVLAVATLVLSLAASYSGRSTVDPVGVGGPAVPAERLGMQAATAIATTTNL